MTTTVLLDTNAYLRLAKRVRPMLGLEFGTHRRYVLLTLPEVETEVLRQPQLRERYPWFDGADFSAERKLTQVRLSKSERGQAEVRKAFLLSLVTSNLDDFLTGRRAPPGETDCFILAVAMVKSWLVATDDENMYLLARMMEQKPLYCCEVLKKLHTAKVVTNAQVLEIFDALERNEDLTHRWEEARERLFAKVFRTVKHASRANRTKDG